MARTIVRLHGKEWAFDEEQIDLEDAFVIKSACGMGVASFLHGVADLDPHCLRALLFWLRRPAEPTLKLESIKFRLVDLSLEQDKGEESDPPTSATEPTSESAPIVSLASSGRDSA